MSDFLHNLRTGNIKRFDRSRKNYDNPQYRHPQDRQYNKDRKGNYHKKVHTGEQLKEIKKHLEGLSQTIESNRAAQEKAASALERIAAVLEAYTGIEPAAPVVPDESSDQTAAVDAVQETNAGESEPASDSKQALLATINALRAEGASYDKIAGELESRRIPTVSGRGKWRGQAVSKLLKEQAG
jgi:hypothetical protein